MVGEEQTLTILYAKEKGIFSVMCAGWQELGNKYWHLSVGFLNRSTIISHSRMDVEVSKKGIEVLDGQLHSWLFSGFVWLTVNLIDG